ncbi:MAG: hypothetical protein ABI589_00265 [Burkholderiales bacterium]
MSKPNDPSRAMRSAVGHEPAPLARIRATSATLMCAASTCAALLAHAPALATVGLQRVEEAPPSVSRTPPTKAKETGTARGGYRIQCWQHGRLLFEEAHVTLPPADGSRFTLKLTGYDSNGRPMYVAETLNATCVVRYDRTLFNPALPR